MTVTVALPRVGILPHRAITGINRMEDAASRGPLEIRDLRDALQRQYTTDAHFTTYEIPGEQHWPRLNKPVLAQLQELGAVVKSRLLVFDFDNPQHAEWTRELFDAFEIQLDHIFEQEPLLKSYYALYTTKCGVRIIYMLEEPVPVLQQEEMLVGFAQLFAAKGLQPDTACFDWTRLFRLPRVVRDGKETWIPDYFPFFGLDIDRADFKPLPNAQVPQVPLHRPKVSTEAIQALPADLPDIDKCDTLVWSNAATGERSAWYIQAKVRLQGRDYWEAIFRDGTLADSGNRNSTIFRAVGSAVSLLITLDGTTPEHVFALFLPCVQRMAEDPSNQESWEETLWRAVRTSWEREAAKISTEPSIAYAGLLADVQANDLIQGIINGVRRWCPPMLTLTDDEVWSVFERKLLLVAANVFYVMKPNGFYDDFPLTAQQLVPRIKSLGMSALIQTTYINEKNQTVQVTVDGLCRAYGFTVSDAHGSLTHDEGSWVSDIMDAKPLVNEPMYSLSPLIVPEYSQIVDAWLRHMAGNQYEQLCTWLAHSLDFSKPIAALFIQGPPSIGKKMLAVGLSENLRQPLLAGAEEIVSPFKSQILHTPFILCNEGFPSTNRSAGTKRPADVFREMIDGTPMYANRKFKTPILVRAPYRLIITANNANGLRGLYGKQDLTPEDRAALNIRLLHLQCGAEAAVWLRKMGGLAFTGKPGERWISGDAGEPSNYLVAKHIRYLYANRKPPPAGYRFLVEGGLTGDDFVEEMALNSGCAPTVLEVLFHLFQQQTPTGLLVDAERKGVFVTAAAIIDHARAMNHPLQRDLNARDVGSVLRGFGESFRLRAGSNMKRWWKLDLGLLFREAESGGYDVVTKLREWIDAGLDHASQPTDDDQAAPTE